MLDYALLVPIYVGLWVALSDRGASWVALGVGFGLTSMAIYFASNPALEVWPIGTFTDLSVAQEDPSRWPDVFVHTALLPLLGIPIGELWDLDALAEDCAATGTYDSFFTSAPLNIPSGVATPPNALAIR